MSGSDNRHTVPEVARLLGISERGVRDKIERGQLRAVKDGKRWIVLLPADDTTASAVAGGSPRGSGAVAGGSDAVVDDGRPGTVTPAEIERAIERTGAKYVADMAALYDRISTEVGRLYEAQLAAKDETIASQRSALATKDQALAADALALAELRRRAEAAETERDALRAQAAPQPPGDDEGPRAGEDSPEVAAGLRGRLARWWRR